MFIQIPSPGLADFFSGRSFLVLAAHMWPSKAGAASSHFLGKREPISKETQDKQEGSVSMYCRLHGAESAGLNTGPHWLGDCGSVAFAPCTSVSLL